MGRAGVGRTLRPYVRVHRVLDTGGVASRNHEERRGYCRATGPQPPRRSGVQKTGEGSEETGRDEVYGGATPGYTTEESSDPGGLRGKESGALAESTPVDH